MSTSAEIVLLAIGNPDNLQEHRRVQIQMKSLVSSTVFDGRLLMTFKRTRNCEVNHFFGNGERRCAFYFISHSWFESGSNPISDPCDFNNSFTNEMSYRLFIFRSVPVRRQFQPSPRVSSFAIFLPSCVFDALCWHLSFRLSPFASFGQTLIIRPF